MRRIAHSRCAAPSRSMAAASTSPSAWKERAANAISSSSTTRGITRCSSRKSPGCAPSTPRTPLRVPQAIAHGIVGEQSYLVLEYLELAPRGGRWEGTAGDEQLAGVCIAAKAKGRTVSRRTISSAPRRNSMPGRVTGSTSGASNAWDSSCNWPHQRAAIPLC